MNKSSELDCYLYFMLNAWSARRCTEIFADTCHEHLWNGWRRKVDKLGGMGAVASWYMSLDDGNRIRIREAAVKYYNMEG